MRQLSVIILLFCCFGSMACVPGKAGLTMACDDIAGEIDACMDAERKFKQACAEGDSTKIREQLYLFERTTERSLQKIAATQLPEDRTEIREAGIEIAITYRRLVGNTYKSAAGDCLAEDTLACHSKFRFAEKLIRQKLDHYNQKLDVLVKDEHIITSPVYYH